MTHTKSGIYIHIPFCVKRCLYCDFFSEEIKDKKVPAGYGKRVISELKERFNELDGTEVVSIYIGGGTPSLMPADFFSDLRNCIFGLNLDMSQMEVTVEINPADIDDLWLKSLKTAGVNRISAGIQSFDNRVLTEMGRRVTVEKMKETLPLITSNFNNISIDMIYGIGENRDIDQELKDVFEIVDPCHVSAYQYLAPEKKKAPKPLDEESVFIQETAINEFLKSRGFNRYEISNYSKRMKESVHNSIYWNFGSWLGIGAGAKSFIEKKREHSFYAEETDSFVDGDGLSRYYPDFYEQVCEFLLMGLRLTDGINVTKFKQLFGKSIDMIIDENVICSLKKEGLIEFDGSVFKCTERGTVFLNHVLIRLFDGIKKQ